MDETQPLLSHVNELPPSSAADKELVDFDPNGDPENPLDWPQAYKTGVIVLLAFMAFTVTFACISVVPVADHIILDLDGQESKSASVLLVTIWELGEAAGPLLIAPLSEVFGRYPVFNVANIIFIFGVVLGAVSQTANLFIFSRFLTGLATASNVLNPAIIGDIFPPESRGSGMSLVMMAPLVGGAVGPAISGTIAESLGWRMILWMSAIVAILCEIVFFTMLRETYKVPILQRKAARLRMETNNASLRCAWDTEDTGARRFWSTLRTSITRPAIVMLDSSVLQLISFHGAIVFTLYYIMATTLPSMLRDVYHFSPAMRGFSFLSFSVGATGGIIICNLFLDKTYVMLGKSHGGKPLPEHRLPFMIGATVFLPAVVTLYGWVPYSHWPVSLLLLAVALLGLTVLVVWVPLASYVVDTFGLYSASALTMVLIVRCLGGTILPLAIPPLTEAFGFGYGFLILGAVCLALIPIPIAVMRYGSRWRQNSVYSRTDSPLNPES